jgi:Subtilase family
VALNNLNGRCELPGAPYNEGDEPLRSTFIPFIERDQLHHIWLALGITMTRAADNTTNLAKLFATGLIVGTALLYALLPVLQSRWWQSDTSLLRGVQHAVPASQGFGLQAPRALRRPISASRRRLQGDLDGVEYVDVIIRYRPWSSSGEPEFSMLSTSSEQDVVDNAFVYNHLTRQNAIAAHLPRTDLEGIYGDPRVVFIEEDGILYKHSETIPYGIKMIQGAFPDMPRNTSVTRGACSDPNNIRIGILDSGFAADHPDSPCHDIDDFNKTNCLGQAFTGTAEELWYNPHDPHGTHVGGIIGAVFNHEGIMGMMGNTHVCYIMGRIFGDNADGVVTSTAIEALNFVVDAGARVINVSFGGAFFSETLAEAVKGAYDRGVLIVASAGNDGVADLNYPASYDGVVSVAAIDRNGAWADFSNFNAGVDLAAPGVEILSTVPLEFDSVAFIDTVDTVGVGGDFLARSVVPSSVGEGVSGNMFLCPDLAISSCPRPDSVVGGHICIVQRCVRLC